MNLMEVLMNAQGGGMIRQLANQFGLDERQATAAVEHLLPALTGGLQRNLSQEGGLESLLGALGSGHHQQYLDDPELLGRSETVADGNGILGHLLGSKEVSRQVAQRASEQTGIGASVLKQMLPLVATMVMGALSKQSAAHGLTGAGARAQSADALGVISQFLDFDRDGSALDDVLGMMGKIFRGR
ncbi:MAG: DUF937 domain-containing protein [Bryobacteraceae bacterium]|nr:DUF937 domain-containing protein [Bryobacteraceae bacterium]MDW8378719.1 DUF937 domain-containing protein [Bryobacterales bacterium]